MDKVDKFITEWRKENNTDDAIYAAYHLDAMIAYAEQETKELRIELLDLRDTNLMFGEIQDMQIDKIKELKELLKELTDLAERNNFSMPYYFNKALNNIT